MGDSLVLALRWNTFSFLPLSVMLAVGLLYMIFILRRHVPSLSTFWRVFIINQCWKLSTVISASIEMIFIESLEKTLESSLDYKEIKPVNTKGNQPWILIERTGAEAGALILWPPDVKGQLTGKDPDAGKDWVQEEKGVMKDEMFRWHHWLSEHEFEQNPGDSEEQVSLAHCSLWGAKSWTWLGY